MSLRRLPPLDAIEARAVAEIPLLGANNAEIEALLPVGRAEAPALAREFAEIEHA